MNLTLNHEIDRLKILQQKNKNIRPAEIQTALHEQLTLTSLIKDARVRLDAIQLILCAGVVPWALSVEGLGAIKK